MLASLSSRINRKKYYCNKHNNCNSTHYLCYFLNFLCTFPVNYEYYYKKTKVVAVVTVTASLVNIALNYVLIRSIGMLGAALATAISHGLQLTMHYCYVRYVLHKGDYPFGIGMWAKYVLVYFGFVVFVYLTTDLWLVRWGVGAARLTKYSFTPSPAMTSENQMAASRLRKRRS